MQAQKNLSRQGEGSRLVRWTGNGEHHFLAGVEQRKIFLLERTDNKQHARNVFLSHARMLSEVEV